MKRYEDTYNYGITDTTEFFPEFAVSVIGADDDNHDDDDHD